MIFILAYKMKAVREEHVLLHFVDEHTAGLVDLRDYVLSDELKQWLDPAVCWATWTLPFERE